MDKDIRFVAATSSSPRRFIARELKAGMHSSSSGKVKSSDLLAFKLSDSVVTALKATDKVTIRTVISNYKRDTKSDEDFEIVPIEVTYRIIDDE